MSHMRRPGANVSPDQDLVPGKIVTPAIQANAVRQGKSAAIMAAAAPSTPPRWEGSAAAAQQTAPDKTDDSQATVDAEMASKAAYCASAALAVSDAASEADSDAASESLFDAPETSTEAAISPGKRAQYSMTDRAVAVALWSNNIKFKEIAKQTGMKRDAFYKLLQRAKQRGFVQGSRILPEYIEDGTRSGRPPNSSPNKLQSTPTKLQSKKARSRNRRKEAEDAVGPDDAVKADNEVKPDNVVKPDNAQSRSAKPPQIAPQPQSND